MIENVAALFVDPRGPYPKLVSHWYDEARDARTYEGPFPIVAHPPCGPWGKLRHLCDRLDEASLAIAALATVRRFGGVMEHPRGSGLWEFCGLPRPEQLPDAFGGRTLEVCQCDWGHPARKRSWLYIVGTTKLPPAPPHREPTHWVSGGRSTTTGTRVPEGIKVCSPQQRRRTPKAFAEWLLELAAGAKGAAYQ